MNQRQIKEMARCQAVCARWNERYPVGTQVTVALDSGEIRTTTTRSDAQVLGGHSAVVWLVGVVGCYELGRVTPVIEIRKDKGVKQ